MSDGSARKHYHFSCPHCRFVTWSEAGTGFSMIMPINVPSPVAPPIFMPPPEAIMEGQNEATMTAASSSPNLSLASGYSSAETASLPPSPTPVSLSPETPSQDSLTLDPISLFSSSAPSSGSDFESDDMLDVQGLSSAELSHILLAPPEPAPFGGDGEESMEGWPEVPYAGFSLFF